MAEQEIEISDLEFKETLSGDDLIPVENSTKTFATSLTKLKDWLLNFFVGLSNDQLISGLKSFNKSPTMPTPAIDDISGKGATTLFVQNMIEKIFPIGSIYSTKGNVNPNSILGFGTWTLITSSIVSGENQCPVYGEDNKSMGLMYYNKTENKTKYGTLHQSAEHDYSNGTNTDTTLGIATKTTNNNLSDKYSNLNGQGYNGYHTGYGVNIVKKGSGNSGVYADLTSISTTLYIWERTA